MHHVPQHLMLASQASKAPGSKNVVIGAMKRNSVRHKSLSDLPSCTESLRTFD